MGGDEGGSGGGWGEVAAGYGMDFREGRGRGEEGTEDLRALARCQCGGAEGSESGRHTTMPVPPRTSADAIMEVKALSLDIKKSKDGQST